MRLQPARDTAASMSRHLFRRERVMQFVVNEQERSAARYAIPVEEIMNWPVTRLSAPQRVALERRFLALERDDRRTRFGGSLTEKPNVASASRGCVL